MQTQMLLLNNNMLQGLLSTTSRIVGFENQNDEKDGEHRTVREHT